MARSPVLQRRRYDGVCWRQAHQRPTGYSHREEACTLRETLEISVSRLSVEAAVMPFTNSSRSCFSTKKKILWLEKGLEYLKF